MNYDINSSGKHLLNLINDVLDFSTVEAGQFSLDCVTLDVAELCRDSLALIEPIAQQKQLRLSFSPDENVTTIQGDPRRLKQVLVNLLSNAVKFTPKGGGSVGLEVRGDADMGTVNFTVWDTGIGIAAADIERIFQPFVQLDSGISRAYEGTGLGLALVYYLVEMHGGAIFVTSALREGSRFTVSLPWDTIVLLSAAKPAVASMKVPMFTASSTLELRPLILVAEDNRLNCKVLCDLLTTVGYRVITAEDGAMAVQATQEHHPDLVLMDIQMPGMNGLEATRHIRADATLRDTPIIALTALAMPGDRERCIAAGTTDYISKPIDAASLLTIVDKTLSDCERNTRQYE
jgi:CheY-like chemotaxis protein